MEEGGFFNDLRQLEFFPGVQDEKQQAQTCLPVVSTGATVQVHPSTLPHQATEHQALGIYQDEESVDLSVLLEACNSDHQHHLNSTVPTSTNPVPGYQEAPQNSSTTTFQPFQNYPNMYGSDFPPLTEMSPSPPSCLSVDCVPTTPSPHVVQIDNMPANAFTTPTALRPAPGKMQRNGKASKKQSLDKNSIEYRLKRDRNNVAVRKSREKSKSRVLDTEKRVKELEEENTHLQSKIALLTKELNVLKSLFTSAGVSQPPTFQVIKDEERREN